MLSALADAVRAEIERMVNEIFGVVGETENILHGRGTVELLVAAGSSSEPD